MSKSNMVCAGIDTGKRKLDVALAAGGDVLTVANDAAGHAVMAAWLRQRQVQRVGIEASGGYEAAVVATLRLDGFVVVVWQPAQVRAYGRFHLQRAKNDRIDAALIAAATAATETVRPPPDPRLAPLAAQLTLIEQLGADIARCKTCRESCREPRLRQFWQAEIARRKALLRGELKLVVTAIRVHRDLAQRLDLINSVDGIGLKTAVAILLRMPEIGRVNRAEAAALAGVAPYDDESGDRIGARHIAGGRVRLRNALYSAALPAAFHWNQALGVLYRRLIANGKSHKQALVACARKLIIYANTVVARATPWRGKPKPMPEPMPA